MAEPTAQSVAASPAPSRYVAVWGRVLTGWRRLPFTVTAVVAMLLLGIGTRSLWQRILDRSWLPNVAYGVPSMEQGHWWTVLSGSLFARGPWMYLPMLVAFALLVGFAEWWIGTKRAVLATVAGQIVGVGVTLGFLFVLRDSGWSWSERLAGRLDVGFSAGALAAATVAAVVLRPPWRLRIQLVLILYVVVAALYIGTLGDVIRLVAVGVALAAGPRLTSGLGLRVTVRPSRREWRLLTVGLLVLIAATSVVAYLLPSDGPLGSTGNADGSWVDEAIVVVVSAALVNGLRKGRRAAWRWAVAISALSVLLGLLLVVFVIVAEGFDLSYDLDGAPLFIADRLLWVALLALLIRSRRAYRVPSARSRRRSVNGAADADTAIELLQRSGGSTLSWMTTWPENSYFVTADTCSYVAYQPHAGVAVALGDPVGPAAGLGGAVREFAGMADRAGLVPCLFSVTEPTAQAATALGWQHVQVAEDTLIDLPELQFRGKSWQDVRSALNKAGKQGITFRMVTLAEEDHSIIAQVRAISEQWVGDKGLPEMGFTLGGVDEALDPHVRVGLAEDADGVIQGVTSWLPVYAEQARIHGWTLDVMRRREDGFRPVVEFLIASSCLAFQSDGAEFVSLSGAPLARTGTDERGAVLDRLLDTLGAALEPLYGFRSLHAFKTKFKPRYQPLFLVYRDEADLPRIGMAMTRAYLPNTPLRELLTLARTERKSITTK